MDDAQFHQTVQQWDALDEPTKPCKKCGKVKALSEFPACKGTLDKHRNDCRRCAKEYIRAWRDRNLERLWAKDKAYAAQPHVRAATYKRNAEWRKSNPVKWRVHQELHKALRKGQVKPQPCWVCGSDAEAHHPDYSAPLAVVWLCKSHHKQAHALVQGQAHEDR